MDVRSNCLQVCLSVCLSVNQGQQSFLAKRMIELIFGKVLHLANRHHVLGGGHFPFCAEEKNEGI